MKRFVSALTLVFLLTLPAFALSDAEYLRMRKSSSDFARADKRLNQVWANLKKSLPRSVFTQLDKLQREWVKSGRDDEAASLMDDGYSKAEAYAIATNDRADSLPKIAEGIREELRNVRNSSQPRKTPSRKPEPKPAPKAPAPKPRRTPEPEPVDEPEPEPESESSVTLTASEIAGEYQSNTGFLSVRIIDINTDEAEVTFSRFKDGVHWTARGWIDNNVIELSDNNYSSCQATLTFSRKAVKVEITETDDWNEAIAPDFVVEGTYRKH
ncbi:MAG: DUF1311 domain-containing protein [Synergistaceae bacterium]|nr:DUF1311 domain-containing protein [Synergistaceae bacterium]